MALMQLPAALLTEVVSSFAETMIVVTGVLAGAARAWAALARLPRARAEWMTAIGFCFGAGVTIALVCIDSILELQ